MNRHWIRALLIVVAVAAACGTGNNPSAGGPPQVTTVVKPNEFYTQGTRYDLTTSEEKNVIVLPILSPADTVWTVLPSVFIELGVDPGTVDQQQRYIANTSFMARRTLGNVRLSRYIDCGGTVSGKTADQATVTLSLTVQVVADSGGVAQLRTQFDGSATLDGAVANKIHCATTGALESRIARMVTDDIARRKKN